FPNIPQVSGIRFATAAAGVRYRRRTDVMLAEIAPGSVIAGVTTRSATRAAPVLDCEAKLALTDQSAGAAFVVNSGNANAFTGGAGMRSVQDVVDAVAERLSIPAARVFTSSTGVIGEPLPHDRIISVLDELADNFDAEAFEPAARAIMTTDTFPKGAYERIETDQGSVTIAGFAKGSGMIAPDMATMLVYLFTDAEIEQAELQNLLRASCDQTFNAISVDSDTSTSDTLLIAATGQSRVSVGPQSPYHSAFAAALQKVMRELSLLVVRDGEGAQKLVEIQVETAASDADARLISQAIANSPLVKTAIAGEDPNWGRIVMAIGKSGAAADRDRLSIWFGDILVAENGWVSAEYREELGAAYMKQDSLVIRVALGLGGGRDRFWT
ncbi:MAG: bifunctional glutamate N-acetyltransferase/amino-acid acetyltransferase ArgJ, partial [Mangrovicoccus sp.]